MKYSQHRLTKATMVAAGLFAVAALAIAPLRAETADPGFVPNTGQINPGWATQGATDSQQSIKLPTPQEARAALAMPISRQPSTGEAANTGQPAAETTGAASSPAASTSNEPPPSGPIGATGQTVPAKFSQRNDVLDRLPIMAWPLALSDQERQRIFQAVMADKSAPAPDADALSPASELSPAQALDGMHALPAGLDGIAAAKGLACLKGKNKVLLVEPATRIVVDQITS